MATGRRPFADRVATALAADIQTETPPSPLALASDLSPRLADIVLKCLGKEPDKRYQSATELRADLRRLAAGESGASVEHTRPRRFALVPIVGVAAVLTVVVIGLTTDWIWDLVTGEADSASVAVTDTPLLAVLPFENLSGDPENEHFSGGMTAELRSRLSRLPDVRVKSLVSSTDGGAGSAQTIVQMREELGVSHVLQGSVRKARDRVRISVVLVDASSGIDVWSGDFDGELDDVFALQEETATQIAEALDLRLTAADTREPLGHRDTDDLEA